MIFTVRRVRDTHVGSLLSAVRVSVEAHETLHNDEVSSTTRPVGYREGER